MPWNTRPQPPLLDSLDRLRAWFGSELGQAVLAEERRLMRRIASRLYGYHVAQIGICAEVDLLADCNVGHPFRVIPRIELGVPEGVVVSDLHRLPFANDCIDALVLHHALEFAEAPHQILREAARVLRPGGKLVVFCFNPFSSWGLVRLGRMRGKEPPWGGNFFYAGRLQDWLQLVGLKRELTAWGGHMLPLASDRWRARTAWLERATARYLRHSGAVLMLMASKETLAMIGRAQRQRRRLLFPVRRPAATRAGSSASPRENPAKDK